MTFVMSYGLSFLSITATISHALIHFWKPVKLQLTRSLKEQPDIHARLMANYPEGESCELDLWQQGLFYLVPELYYAIIFGKSRSSLRQFF